MSRLTNLVALVGLCFGVPLPVMAQSFPDGAGRSILETQCSACHTPEIVRTPRRTAEEWRDIVLAMNDLGAKVSDDQFPVLVDYLATHFSKAASAPAAEPEAPSESQPTPVTTAARKSPDASDVIKRLPEAKVSLLDGILQAERGNGPAISAKFEIDGGELVLSVYNAKKGMGLSAEHNVLTELKGDATKSTWQPTLEVFEDKPHIARASVQLTVMQLSKVFLVDLIEKARALQPGVIYSAIPDIKGGKPIVEFLFASPDNRPAWITLDAQTGDKIP